MKVYSLLLLGSIVLSGCNNTTPGDFRSAKERMEEEQKGNAFGKDALGWNWTKDADEKSVAANDPLWAAASRIMSQYPISFNNFHARIIQTDWITSLDHTDMRYRFTLRTLGKEPTANNIEVLMMVEKKQGNTWLTATPDLSIQKALTDRIVSEAVRIYDQNKRD